MDLKRKYRNPAYSDKVSDKLIDGEDKTMANGNGNGTVVRLGKVAGAILGIGTLLFVINSAVFAKKDSVAIKFETMKDKQAQTKLDMTIEFGEVKKLLGEIKLEQGYINTNLGRQATEMNGIKKEQRRLNDALNTIR